MAISFIGGTSLGAANGGAITLTLPGSMAVDDLIIVCHGDADTVDNAMPAMTTAGYTDVGSSELFANGSVTKTNQKTWYKYHNGTDTNAVTAAIGGTNAGNSSTLMVFRGVALAVDGGPFSTAAVPTSGTGGTAVDPAQIATAAGDWVVVCGTAGHLFNSGTFTLPTGYTTNAQGGATGNDTGGDATTGMGYNSAPANPENPGTFTLSTGSAAGDSWAAVTLALKEAPAAVPEPPIFVTAPRSWPRYP